MENTTTIINGQPQSLGNRMVTWDGLNDFFNMLKNEIPRMGVNNIAGSYSYSLGQNNKDYSRLSFLVGEDNKVNVNDKEHSYLNYLFGANNEVNGGKYTFTFGGGNVHRVAEDVGTSAFGVIFGNRNLNKGQHCFLAGTGNLTDQAASYTYIFGNENYGGKDSNKKTSVGIGLFNGFIVGENNLISNPILSNGSLNVHNERIYVFGSGHKIHNARGIVCFGENNIVNNGDNITYNTFLYGSNLTGWYQGTAPAYILGQYNDHTAIEYNLDPEEGEVKLGAAFVIGDGHSNVNSDPTLSNLLVIGYDGEFRLKDGYFSQPTAFNDVVTFNDVIECNDTAMFSATTTFKSDLEMYNEQGIEIKVVTGESQSEKISVARLNSKEGITFLNKVSFKNLEESIVYGHGYPELTDLNKGGYPADSAYTKKIYWDNIRLIDGNDGNNSANMLFYNHGFRNILHPYNANEAIWTTDTNKILHINYRSKYGDQTVQEYTIPTEIHFHDGTNSGYAKLKCGDFECAKVQTPQAPLLTTQPTIYQTTSQTDEPVIFTNLNQEATDSGLYYITCNCTVIDGISLSVGNGTYKAGENIALSGVFNLTAYHNPDSWETVMTGRTAAGDPVSLQIYWTGNGLAAHVTFPSRVAYADYQVVKLYSLPKEIKPIG